MTQESHTIDLEIRLAHQEAALEALTVTSHRQQRAIDDLRAELEQVKALLRDMAPPAAGAAGDEPPPPHY